MALVPQTLNVNFAQGLDTKTDPFQVSPGKFLSLHNSVFTTAGQLAKRNGYGILTNLPDNSNRYITTFNNNLTAIGTTLNAFSANSNQWIDKGTFQPLDIETLPLIRSNTYQGQADTVVANGIACTAYTDFIPSGGSVTPAYKYVITDATTGQNIVEPTLLVGADTTFGTPRVFVLGNYFIILYTTHPSAYHIQYIAISIMNPTTVTTPADITNNYIPSTTINFDGVVVDSKLFIAYNTTSGGQSVKVTYLTSSGSVVTPTTFAGSIATMFSLSADITNSGNPIIYVSFYDLPSTSGFTCAVDQNLNIVLSPAASITGESVANITSIAQNGSCLLYQEVILAYTYNSGFETNLVTVVTITQSGTVELFDTVVRSVGLASKAFLYNGVPYFLAVYDSPYQPTYFLINGSGEVIAKLAYSNAGPYNTLGLPNVTINSTDLYVNYLYKDQIDAVNKTQGVANTAGIYAQLGVNLATFNFKPSQISTSEIGNNLNLTGGFVYAYDGFELAEQGFFLWPDYVEATPSNTGGSMTAQTYFYQVTYEWADNQGNVFRSAPSIPVEAIVASGVAGSVTLDIPTLRLTYKTLNPIVIVIYRWSQTQQNYFQVTSITAPILNDMTADSITYIDTLADASILGNNLIYTTGGVLEDIAPPATNIMTLFNNRLWVVDAEDRNLLWFSKQVIEATPVEMSDLLTLYIAPTTASQGSTGVITALSPMDDKLIIFKANALGYINGIGPDNTGANNQYSDFVLINSVVGCTNTQSIVFTPNGLMFQSEKGIWILGRDLSTNYIGAPVEGLTNGALVDSAVNVPGSTQVRFTLNTGITLMYDYYYGQWGTFTNVPALSSTLYNNLHTYINSLGQVFQETPGTYLDNTSPVLMGFTTSWMSLGGIQGFERVWEMLLLGTYITPFKLNTQIAYNYNSSNLQATIITPSSPSGVWGSDPLWGSSSLWGGPSSVFKARLFPTIQKCQSFQITISELYDNSLGIAPGAGLTLSGLNLQVGIKKGSRNSPAARSFG